jgi:class 3 adenylate cyclase
MAKYEGFIERFAGDGVLALFGVPIGLIIPNIVSADFGY